MSTTPPDANPPAPVRAVASRQGSLRSVLLLVVAAGTLLVFIVGVGDFRRKHNALAQMEWHCGTYVSRMGDTGTLPLNLEPDIADVRKARMIKLHWISREEARALRSQPEPVIAAYTVPIPCVLTAKGRAVAYFDNGAFRVEWVGPDEFNRRLAKQRDMIDERTHAP